MTNWTSTDDTSWITRLRSVPSIVCPSEQTLEMFATEPLAIEASNLTHIVHGCNHCRARLRRMMLDTA